ncbi:MAG: hypothetical protein CBB69_009615 [Phycisphaera sp. TMED9]|nr:MAG: hypothetical protein CBB69_009615 [Phycisphaera sp. TMED9]
MMLLSGILISIITLTPPPAEPINPPPSEARPSVAPDMTPDPVRRSIQRLQDAERIRVSPPARALSLEGVLEILAGLSGIRLDADWSALETIGINPDDRVTPDPQPGSLRVVLDQILAQVGADYERPVIDGSPDGLRLTTVGNVGRHASPLLHPIADLVEPREPIAESDPPATQFQSAEEITALIRNLIATDGWYDVGGSIGRIETRPRSLLIMAPAFVQLDVGRFLQSLRIARPDQVAFSISVVGMPSSELDRIRLAHEPGSPASIIAIKRSPLAAQVFEGEMNIEPGGSATIEASDSALETSITLTLRWDSARHRLRCDLHATLTGPVVGGTRSVETEIGLEMPVDANVMMVPALADQPPLAVLVTARAD